MKTKVLEVRDEGTCIPVVAIKMEAANLIEDRFLWRCGYPRDGSGIIYLRLDDQRANSDPYHFSDRSNRAAHLYILDHWDDLQDGDVVDVRVYLGEAHIPVDPEIWTAEKANA